MAKEDIFEWENGDDKEFSIVAVITYKSPYSGALSAYGVEQTIRNCLRNGSSLVDEGGSVEVVSVIDHVVEVETVTIEHKKQVSLYSAPDTDVSL